jgi:hypothetical protein
VCSARARAAKPGAFRVCACICMRAHACVLACRNSACHVMGVCVCASVCVREVWDWLFVFLQYALLK